MVNHELGRADGREIMSGFPTNGDDISGMVALLLGSTGFKPRAMERLPMRLRMD